MWDKVFLKHWAPSTFSGSRRKLMQYLTQTCDFSHSDLPFVWPLFHGWWLSCSSYSSGQNSWTHHVLVHLDRCKERFLSLGLILTFLHSTQLILQQPDLCLLHSLTSLSSFFNYHHFNEDSQQGPLRTSPSPTACHICFPAWCPPQQLAWTDIVHISPFHGFLPCLPAQEEVPYEDRDLGLLLCCILRTWISVAIQMLHKYLVNNQTALVDLQMPCAGNLFPLYFSSSFSRPTSLAWQRGPMNPLDPDVHFTCMKSRLGKQLEGDHWHRWQMGTNFHDAIDLNFGRKLKNHPVSSLPPHCISWLDQKQRPLRRQDEPKEQKNNQKFLFHEKNGAAELQMKPWALCLTTKVTW